MKNTDRKKAKEIYLENKGDIALTEIAAKVNRPAGTVRGWKSKDKWDDFLNGTFQEKTERSKKKERSKKNKSKNKKKSDDAIVKEVVANNELTDKQQLFCIYYLKYFNATKAYQKAYRCDYTIANSHGYKLLSNVVIKQQIEKLKKERMQEVYLEGKDILQKYIDIAFADITDYLEFGTKTKVEMGRDGQPLLDPLGNHKTYKVSYIHFKQSSNIDGTIISEASQGKDGIKIKLLDKMKALDFLAKNIDSFHMDEKELLKAKISTEKAKTEKLQYEIDNIKDDDTGKETKDWVSAIEEIAARRRDKNE